jgi:hypothetical protein
MVKNNPADVEMKDAANEDGSSVDAPKDGKDEDKKEEVKKHPDLLTLEGLQYSNNRLFYFIMTF